VKPEHAPTRASDAVTVDFDGDLVIYHRQTGGVHRLDSIGAIVWHCLDGRTTVEELVADLSTGFDVDPSVVRNDVVDLLERLGQAFLLAEGPTAAPLGEPQLLTNPPSR
jgi:hypothetical protein